MQLLRQSFLHLCTVIHRLPPTDIGTGVWSQEVVALPICVNTVCMCLSFRINRCAKTAPICRSRLHSGDARPACRLTARRTRHHQTRQERLHSIAKEHQRWDGCRGPHRSPANRRLYTIGHALGNSGWGLFGSASRNFYNQCQQFCDVADNTRTEIVNYGIHFLMGDASNAGMF